MEARVYTATKDGDTCVKGEAFIELALPSHFCLFGSKFLCTGASAKKEIYWEGDNDAERIADAFNPLHLLDPTEWRTKANCTATVQSEEIIWEAGCDDAGTSFTTVEFCSIASNPYSSLILLIVVATFVYIM
eukprot:UN10163